MHHAVFHAALIVFAALQVHETRTALVRLQDCDGSVDFVVSPQLVGTSYSASYVSPEMWGSPYSLQESGTIPGGRSLHHRLGVAGTIMVRQGAVRRIRVCTFFP